MYRKTSLKILISFLFFVFSIENTWACMYGPPYRTVCENYNEADFVIIGTIENVKSINFVQIVNIKINKTFKGQKLKQIILTQPTSSCDPNFSDDIGKTLLFYVIRNRKNKRYSAIAPGTGGRVERKNEELYWLNNLPISLKRTRLSGRVELYQNEPFKFLNNVVGTKIKIFNDKNSFEVSTDKNGVYEFWDIPTGKYQIEPIFPFNLKLSFDLERGLIDFDSLKKKDSTINAVLVDMQPRGCGGIDFIVNEKSVE